jgi:hypothetical protein
LFDHGNRKANQQDVILTKRKGIAKEKKSWFKLIIAVKRHLQPHHKTTTVLEIIERGRRRLVARRDEKEREEDTKLKMIKHPDKSNSK